jgi:hypothetical protein
MNACNCTPTTSIYDTGCLACCVRLVRSARPSRSHQNAMLAHIERQAGASQVAATIEALKEATS